MELRSFAALQETFRIGLQDFDWFRNRTLFVRVTAAANLRACHADLMGWCAARLANIPLETRPFTPHMTLATRDLPPDQVPVLRQLSQARSYTATFEASSCHLFRHDGQRWQPIDEFKMKAL